MRREGVLRERLYNKGKYVDVALYAILRSDPRPGHALLERENHDSTHRL